MEYIEKTGAENVGGPMIAQGKTQTQNVIAAAYHNPFAMGGGKFHNENYEGYADTVYLGAFKKETLLHLNMYDERLPRSEDDDLNFRILENGGKIFVTPKIKVCIIREVHIAMFLNNFLSMDFGKLQL